MKEAPRPAKRAHGAGKSDHVEEEGAADWSLFDEHAFEPACADPQPSKRARVEDVYDDDDDDSPNNRRPTTTSRFVEPYPRSAGTPLSQACPKFEKLKAEQEKQGENEWAPFRDKEEWELARWLSARVGHTGIEEYLALPIVQKRMGLSFNSKYTYLKKLDQLPKGPAWKCHLVTAEGDLLDEDGNPMKEELELWFRDPIECVRELMADPNFKEHTSFAPERVYSDKEGVNRIYDEMWTGDWWWEMQENLPDDATVAPLILSSDKTQLSMFQGDKSAWPVYLTLGNISKEVRRQPSAHATILLAYLPVPKLTGYAEATQSVAGNRLFHYCMSMILEVLKGEGGQGIEMDCGDEFVRLFYLILAAYVADYPEQCLVACCKENRCLRCTVSPKERGEWKDSPSRTPEGTLHTLAEHQAGGDPIEFDEHGMRAVYNPFWKDLPHANIFKSLTPDLLHQVHKGVFKDHLVKWCTKVVGKDEIDARFRTMTPFAGLRHFKQGISSVGQWTGTEHKEMEKIFLSVVAGGANTKVVTVAKALLDFIYFSQLQLHTTQTIAALEKCLETFHKNKDVLIELKIRKHFNIPKLHNVTHYPDFIRELGSTDGYNTEAPERLHIDYAKTAYRPSNKRDYTEQMAGWLQRQESIWMKDSYLMWRSNGLPDLLKQTSQREGERGENEDEEELDEEMTTVTSVTDVAYHVAKVPPFQTLTAEKISSLFGALDFIPALTSYLRGLNNGSPVVLPSPIDRFSGYRQINLKLPTNPYLSGASRTHRIRTTPTVPAKGRKRAKPATLDVALVVEDRKAYRLGKGLAGLRAAQVRFVFDLPPHLGRVKHPLAYVEWFTPLGQPDSSTGMLVVKRSTRNLRRNAAVICVSDLVCAAHLTAKNSGSIVDKAYTSHQILDTVSHFYVNTYIDVHTFTLVHCLL
ncbi:hypothetical protein CPC08DRAFT_648414 [Agrocybe pediades]|nr:hypothetical protein CPC08DRAFT_648414 [Agrocybe pediades]